MERTLFQKIIDREIPATIEYEDDHVIAIRDIAPSAPVHLLIIPKKPIRSANELHEDDAALMGRITLVAQQLAKKFNIAESGYRLVTNVNADGGQTVFHLHVHLLGGQPLGRMNSHAADHSAPSAPSASAASGMLREAGLFVLCALGLAIAFNSMNPRAITWSTPTLEHVEATADELEKFLQVPSVPAPAASVADTATAATTAVAEQQPTTPAASTSAPTQASASTFTPAPGVVREIDLAAFKKFLQQPHLLIDARLPESYAAGHIGNAINVYGGEVQSKIGELLSIVPRDRVILIYCDGGDECELSHHVADVLKQFGYGPLLIYKGGWNEWIGQRQ